MKGKKLTIHSNPNIGLYAFANDQYCLVGSGFQESQLKEIEEMLDVPVHVISIGGTPLIGVFVTGNNNGIVIPNIVYEHEKKKLDDLGIKYIVSSSRHSALGNNIAIGDGIGYYAEEMEPEAIEEIEKFCDLKIEKVNSEITTMGSIMLIKNGKALIGEMVGDNIIKQISENLIVNRATLNQGSDYLRSACFYNTTGFLIGADTSGIEILTIEQDLFSEE